jgi:hypothetical protein
MPLWWPARPSPTLGRASLAGIWWAHVSGGQKVNGRWMEWYVGQRKLCEWCSRTFGMFDGTQVRCNFYNGTLVKTSNVIGIASQWFIM